MKLNKNNFKKKGAMFGLDARIALAIFGALSVISGAVLYSAVEEAKNISFYTQSQEIIKSLEHYYLDQQELPPKFSTAFIDIRYLIENIDSSNSWNGPYIGCKRGATTDTYGYLYCKGIGNKSLSTYIRIYNDSLGTCASGDDCSLWLFYHVGSPYIPEYRATFNYLDKKYDGNSGASSGNIHLYENGSTMYIYMKIMKYN